MKSKTGKRQQEFLPRLPRVDNLDDFRWRAVESRDERGAGLFVYAVRTTGVYCRPGCGSRRAKRTNVEFFDTALEAERSGFRACLRCRPQYVESVDPTVAAVIEVCRELERADGEHVVATLASRLGYSERHLRRRFVRVVGVPVGSYLRAHSAQRARAALRSGSPVTDAIVEAGYGSARAFYEHGAHGLGMSPSRYRDGGRGERIRFTSVATPIGTIVVARTARGVCSLELGAEEPVLVDRLVAEFPNAQLQRDDDGLVDVARVLAMAIRGETDATVLPVDLEGTAFQIRVWEALRRIPMGQTRTYTQVAADIGAPAAVRAVASACAANGAALAVPCHRVVRRDGTLGGYRWGLEVKEALLAVEATSTS